MSNPEDPTENFRRLFTIEQAIAMLPLVRAIVTDMSQLSSELIERRERLALLREGRPGKTADYYDQELQQVEQEMAADAKRLRDYLEELQALGVEPKNGPEGIVDFPSLQEGKVVLLCWKLGEESITHWHDLEAGFVGRQEVPNAWRSRDKSCV